MGLKLLLFVSKGLNRMLCIGSVRVQANNNELEIASVAVIDTSTMPINAHVKYTMLRIVNGDTCIQFTSIL